MSHRARLTVVLAVLAAVVVIALYPWVSGAAAALRNPHLNQLAGPVVASFHAPPAPRPAESAAALLLPAGRTAPHLLDLICILLC